MMNTKSQLMFRVLMNRFLPGESDDLLSCLPEEEAKALEQISIGENDPSLVFVPPDESLRKIHYSWFIEPLKKMAELQRRYTIACLDKPIQKKLAQLLRIDKIPDQVGSLLRKILIARLLAMLEMKDVLPLAFVPKENLSLLTSLSKKQILDIIDCLGAYDVASEINQIVDKEKLSLILDCLTRKQKKFLKKIIHEQEKGKADRLGLDQWGGDKVKLHRVLHKRGLKRLGTALSGFGTDFIFHFVHQLDVGRASQIQTFAREQVDEQDVRNQIANVIKAMNFVKDYE